MPPIEPLTPAIRELLRLGNPTAAATRVGGFGHAAVTVLVSQHIVSGITDLQHQLALEAALDNALQIPSNVKVRANCFLNAATFGCPGKGTRTSEEVRELLKERAEAAKRQTDSIRPILSLPSWRPIYRTWLRQLEEAFNRMEEIVLSGEICKRDEQEPICRISFPAMVRRCVRFEEEGDE